jgi:thiazole synthase
MSDSLVIAGRSFRSRLLLGTGKFGDHATMASAVKASAAEIVTVAVRRFDPSNPSADILSFLDPSRLLILPNTSGCRTAEEVMRVCRLVAASGMERWIKLELTPDLRHLLPDPIETLKAAEALVKEGFTVLPYIQADPVLAKRLEDCGTAAVMPLAAPIGTNLGLRTRDMIELIIQQARVPVVVDAGLGKPSDAALCLELGADAVLVNTAIAVSRDPVAMADAFRKAVEAGRQAHLAGLGAVSSDASASSPLTGFLS